MNAGLTITEDTQGFTFVPVDGAEITDERLANLQVGDKVVYEDYVYAYGCEKLKTSAGSANASTMNSWSKSDIKGWGVSVIDESIDKSQLSEMCGNILGMPVISARRVFTGWRFDRRR